MKQLSNSPEAVAYFTGLYGEALRNRASSLFGRTVHCPRPSHSNAAVPGYARGLLQQTNR
jgi:hypothetical protein